MSAPRMSRIAAFLVLASSVLSLLLPDVPGLEVDGGVLSHPRIRLLGPDGEGIEGAQLTAVANGTVFIASTSSSGWAVFGDYEGDTFPPGSAFTATKEGYRTISWSQGEAVPTMVVAREDDTLLVILLIGMTVLSALVLLALAFKGRQKRKDRS